MEYSSVIIKQFSNNKYTESIIKFIMELMNNNDKLQKNIDDIMTFFDYLNNEQDEMTIEQRKLYLDYFNWMIKNSFGTFDNTLSDYLFTSIDSTDLWSNIIETSKELNDDQTTYKVLNIISYIIPELIDRECLTDETLIESIHEIIDDNEETENMNIQERIILLKCILQNVE